MNKREVKRRFKAKGIHLPSVKKFHLYDMGYWLLIFSEDYKGKVFIIKRDWHITTGKSQDFFSLFIRNKSDFKVLKKIISASEDDYEHIYKAFFYSRFNR